MLLVYKSGWWKDVLRADGCPLIEKIDFGQQEQHSFQGVNSPFSSILSLRDFKLGHLASFFLVEALIKLSLSGLISGGLGDCCETYVFNLVKINLFG